MSHSDVSEVCAQIAVGQRGTVTDEGQTFEAVVVEVAPFSALLRIELAHKTVDLWFSTEPGARFHKLMGMTPDWAPAFVPAAAEQVAA